MKRVLVTGASGFIGKTAVNALLDEECEVHAVTSCMTENNPSRKVSWHTANLLDIGQIRNLIEHVRPTHLLHLAWYVEHSKYWSSLENLRWVEASLQLAQEFGRAGGRRIVCAGTCAEYDWNYQKCSEAETPIRPNSLYGASKAGLSLMLQQYALSLEIEFCWTRLFFPYGPGENKNRLIPQTVLSLLAGTPVTCQNPSYERDFVTVDNVGEILAKLTDSSATGFVNIGSGVPTALGTFVTMIASSLGKVDLLELSEVQAAGDASVLFADPTRLVSILGNFPFTSLELGIERTIDWWRYRR